MPLTQISSSHNFPILVNGTSLHLVVKSGIWESFLAPPSHSYSTSSPSASPVYSPSKMCSEHLSFSHLCFHHPQLGLPCLSWGYWYFNWFSCFPITCLHTTARETSENSASDHVIPQLKTSRWHLRQNKVQALSKTCKALHDQAPLPPLTSFATTLSVTISGHLSHSGLL